jgi:mono/diheme cytochrome c family protein
MPISVDFVDRAVGSRQEPQRAYAGPGSPERTHVFPAGALIRTVRADCSPDGNANCGTYRRRDEAVARPTARIGDFDPPDVVARNSLLACFCSYDHVVSVADTNVPCTSFGIARDLTVIFASGGMRWTASHPAENATFAASISRTIRRFMLSSVVGSTIYAQNSSKETDAHCPGALFGGYWYEVSRASVPSMSGPLLYRLTFAFAATALSASAAQVASSPPSATSDTLKRYCAGCHNAKVKTGAFALDNLDVHTAGQHAGEWEKVVRKLRTRSMPPAGLPRPDESTYKTVLASIETSLDNAAAAKPNPGRTDTFRRLSRTEYRNAIRDLLAIEMDVSSLLPSDESSHGFDNITVGDLSPTLLERYLGAARKISRLAVGTPPRSPGGDTITLPPDLTQEDQFEDLPIGTRGGTTVRYNFPVDAKYEIQIRLARDRNEHVEGLREAEQVELMLDGQRLQLFTVEPPPRGKDHSAVDQHLNIRVPVKAGPHVVAVAFPKTVSPLLETERQPWHAHFNMDRHPRIRPALYSISVNGPYDVSGPGDTPSRQRLFVCKPASAGEEDACAKRILSTLIRRAYRRPVTDADLQAPLRFYKEGRKDGGFDSGVEMALNAILVSPEFLFRVEQDPSGVATGTPYRVSDLELASRLSFFLWSSIPDDELLDLASQGKLKSPAVLEKQVRRMLADSRSSSLVTKFAEQWLYLRNLASTTPDMRLFPDFDDNLRNSFRKETELFFESILREDRSVVDLLAANYTYLNERLAKHYGIPNVYGSRFRRVNFGPDSVRGGLLRQGSVLTVTSYATRTSPVIRGKWVLDNILGIPPPPPPASVPALKEKTWRREGPVDPREDGAASR